MKKKFQEIFSLDVRALFFLRIGLGTLVAADIAFRFPQLRQFYVDSGMFPRGWALIWSHPYSWSLYYLSGSLFFTLILFILTLLASVSLLIGYFPRLATVLSWLLMLSLHYRNPVVLNGGDQLLLLMLFWAMFLPLPAAGRFKSNELFQNIKTEQFFSIATVGFILQILSVYFFAGMAKSGSSWVIDYNAIELTLKGEMFTTRFGRWWAEFPEFLQFLTWLIRPMEIIAPLLLLIPFLHSKLRLIVIISLTFFHLGLALCMTIGLFPYVCLVAIWSLLPSSFWSHAFVVKKLERLSNLLDSCSACLEKKLVRPFNGDTRKGRDLIQFAVRIFLTCCLLFSLVSNLSGDRVFNYQVPKFVQSWLAVFKLDQEWNLFSPNPITRDLYPVFEGRLRNNQAIDVFSLKEGAPAEKIPDDYYQLFPNAKSRKFFRRLTESVRDGNSVLDYYGAYYCNKWNKEISNKPENELAVISMKVYYVSNKLKQNQVPKKVLIWNHWCFNEYKPAWGENIFSSVEKLSKN